MNTADKNILRLIEILKTSGRIKYDTEFCEAIGLRKQNLVNIKADRNHFTPEQIERVLTTYKINANWIFGLSSKMSLTMETVADTR